MNFTKIDIVSDKCCSMPHLAKMLDPLSIHIQSCTRDIYYFFLWDSFSILLVFVYSLPNQADNVCGIKLQSHTDIFIILSDTGLVLECLCKVQVRPLVCRLPYLYDVEIMFLQSSGDRRQCGPGHSQGVGAGLGHIREKLQVGCDCHWNWQRMNTVRAANGEYRKTYIPCKLFFIYLFSLVDVCASLTYQFLYFFHGNMQP